MIKFDIVIVNWNSGEQLKNCLQSIEKSNKSNCDLNSIIVVDNASVDDSISNLCYPSLPIQLIKNNTNLGFGKACNIGAKDCQSNFILFLNPDMIVYEDTFLNLFKYIENNDNEDIGIYGIQLHDEDKEVQKTCARFPTVWNFVVRSLGLNKLNNRLFKSYTMHEWDHLSSREVDQVMGAFFMVKRSLFESLDGFDERFFVYYEELDFSKRASDIGYLSKYIVEAKAYHKGGGTSENVKAMRMFYNLQSRSIYALKHFSLFKAFVVLFFVFTIEPLSRMTFILIKQNKIENLRELLTAYKLLYFNIFLITRKGLM